MSILTESSTKRLSLEKFQRICTKRLRLCQQIAGGNTPVESIDRFHRDGKTDRMAVVAGQFRWSDIGSWDALFEITTPRSR